MRPVIRPFEPADADAAAELRRVLMPAYVETPAGLLHSLATEPPRTRRRNWVALDDGLVAWGTAGFEWAIEADDVAYVWVGVREDRRGQGLGTRLFELAEAHVRAEGARRLESWTIGDGPGTAFLERRGYRPTRSNQMWSLDPRTVDLTGLPRLEAERAREGLRLVTLRELRGRERDVHAAYAEVEADMPADEPEMNFPFEEWRRHIYEHPDLSHDGTFLVLAGERPVSLAFIVVDQVGGRAAHDMTGTVREYRRRGLARLAKMAALRWCADSGVRTVFTSNDTTNADMLALNEHLGYRPLGRNTTYRKDF